MTEYQQTTEEHEPHPNYVLIGIVLGIITVLEVGITMVAVPRSLMNLTLIGFAIVKALFVVGYYMHLKFDSVIYTILFTTGILFTLLLSTTFYLLF